MQDLQLIGVHEDGEHLLLAGADGVRFRVRVDDALRAAIRRDRPGFGQLRIEVDGGMRPREVQSMVRAGASAEEVAERAGWTVEKVRRYEGPIVAEREHVARLAQGVHVRGRGGTSGGPSAPTLTARVSERLAGRGVNQDGASWDAWRREDGPWTVVLTFPAGGRQRHASWHFDAADRTVTAVDDEARWLSEDEQPPAGPIPAPHLASAPDRGTTVYTVQSSVYDVEAEGGLRPVAPRTPAVHPEPGLHTEPAPSSEHTGPAEPTTESPAEATPKPTAEATPEPTGEPVDLMTAMRGRTTARGRRRSGARRVPAQVPTNLPGSGDRTPDDALPLDDLAFDPETMAPPPAAHAEPDPDGVDGRPEPDAAADTDTDTDTDAERQPSTGPEPEQAEASAVPKPRARTPRRSGRTSVPAWDDIIFGARPGTDR